MDLCRQAAAHGAYVRLLCLAGGIERDDVGGLHEVRRLRWSDPLYLDGIVHTHCLRPDLVGSLFKLRGRCFVVTTLHNYFLIDLSFDHERW